MQPVDAPALQAHKGSAHRKQLVMIKIAVGFDHREAVTYHTFCQSVIDNSTGPVSFIPLALPLLKDSVERPVDGSTSFVYSRFLTPHLNEFSGWCIYADGDMVCLKDIHNLWDMRDETKAVLCVHHDYKSTHAKKFLGGENHNYPRKNWSSLILWNCGHPKNAILTPEFVKSQSGAFLHRFNWLNDNDVGKLDPSWNWLAIEYPDNTEANLVHYTLGTPCFKDFQNSAMAELWWRNYESSQSGIGQ